MLDLTKIKKVYFIGIKGAGMSALAQVFKSQGLEVLGSDVQERFFTDQLLKQAKIPFQEGFSASNLPAQLDLAVVSAAYYPSRDHPEVLEVLKRKIPLLTYAQALGLLFQQKYGLAVAGTHGKSTVTAMLGLIMEEAGWDPTVILGSQVIQWQSNVRLGQSDYLFVEADEYRNNFLSYYPQGLVITNLEYDHPDFFKDQRDYQAAFEKLIKRIPPSGFIVADQSKLEAEGLLRQARAQIIDYSAIKERIELIIPGQHNYSNAQAALAASLALGLDQGLAKKTLSRFKGLNRRLEFKGKVNGVVLIDDYAHHPTEVHFALAAIRGRYPQGRIWAVFQPHTYSRTKKFLKAFTSCFGQADYLIVLDVYSSAREKPNSVNSRVLAQAIAKEHPRGIYLGRPREAVVYLKSRLKANDLLVTLGAGNVNQVLDWFSGVFHK